MGFALMSLFWKLDRVKLFPWFLWISSSVPSKDVHSMVPAWCTEYILDLEYRLWWYWPQDVIDPDNVAFVGGFVVNGDCGSGLDPQVASSPLEPTIVAWHHLAFPQHWEVTGGRWSEKMYDGRQEKKNREEGLSVVWHFMMMAAGGAYHNRTGW